MHKRIVPALAGLLALAGLTAPGAQADSLGGDPSGSSTLQRASDLPRTVGGGGHDGRGYMPLRARALAESKAAANRRAGVRGGAAAAGSTAPVVTAYPNVTPSFAGTDQSGLTPPDTTGAVGPDRYIETVNTTYAIYDRTGTQISSGPLSALTNVAGGLFGHGLSDPQMMWDPTTQRFYYLALYYDSLTMTDNGLAIGWSKTASPSSSADFCQYTIGFGSGFPDYPKLGDSKDFLLFGYNLFSSGGSTYQGSEFGTLNKPPAGSTCPSTSVFRVYYSGLLTNADGSNAATPVPANLVDRGEGTGYVVANPDMTVTRTADYLSVFTLSTDGTDANGIPVPFMTGPAKVTVPAYRIPANAPQQGSSYLLDTLDGRFEAAVAAADPDHGGGVAIWTAHAVYGGPGAEERWYEVDPSSNALLQSGTVGSSSLFAWNGTISPDRADNGSTATHGNSMAMSVSTSSASSYPAIQFVSKAGAAPQSPLNVLVQAGGANVDFSCGNTACRWGDYSGASPDPAATGGTVGRVWLGNQYNLAGGTTSSTVWRTWVFAVAPAPPATGSLSFTTSAQSLAAGSTSSAMQVALSAAQAGDVQVTLGSTSPTGEFATTPSGTGSPTLSLAIAGGQTTTSPFYYRDTHVGTPTLTATASGFASASQTETVTAAALSSIAVAPNPASVPGNGTQVFSATGADQYGNPVSVSTATWTTTVSGSSVSPGPSSSTTFTAGSTAASGWVSATLSGITGKASVTVTVATPPPAPTNLTATLKGKRITLSWSGSNGVTYRLYRGTSSGGESLYVNGLSGTSYADSNITSGRTYWYYVTAVSAAGESPHSSEVSVRVR